MSEKTIKKVLIFAPHAGIWVHSVPEAILAHNIRETGYEVVYVTCDGTFSKYCVVMSAHGVDQDSPAWQKKRVCQKCTKSGRHIAERYNFRRLSLKDYLTDTDGKTVQNILESAQAQNLYSMQLEGIPLGRRSLYEFLLQYKKSDLNFSEKEWSHFLMALDGAARSTLAGKKILDQEKPDIVIAYNTQYSVNGVIEELCKLKQIPIYYIHGGLNISRSVRDISIAHAPPPTYYKKVASHWKDFAKKPCSPEQLARVSDHFKELFKANSVFVYSSPLEQKALNIRQLYKIRPDQKILVATMSSYDERFAAEANGTLAPVTDAIFSSQIEWVKFLIQYIRTRPDLFLLVRVHPREFPNKREKVKSQHALNLEQALKTLPNNAAINWPNDNVSLYRLAQEASVFLNAWSSTGKEMSLLGLPVILYTPKLPFYAPEINYIAETKEDYIAAIEDALKTPFSFERVKEAYRLFVLEFERPTFDLWPAMDKPRHQKPTFLRKVINKLTKVSTSISGLKQMTEKNPSLPHIQSDLHSLLSTNADTLLSARKPSEFAGDDTDFIRSEHEKLIKILEVGSGRA